MYIGKLSYEDKEIGRNIRMLSILLVIYGISQFCYNLIPVGKYFRIPYSLIAFGGSIFLVILFEIIEIKNMMILDKILKYLGSISLEIYLSHIMLRRLWLQSTLFSKANKSMNLKMYLLIVLLGSILMSGVIAKVGNKIYKKIKE